MTANEKIRFTLCSSSSSLSIVITKKLLDIFLHIRFLIPPDHHLTKIFLSSFVELAKIRVFEYFSRIFLNRYLPTDRKLPLSQFSRHEVTIKPVCLGGC